MQKPKTAAGAAMRAANLAASPDKLQALSDKLVEARDLELGIASKLEELNNLNTRLTVIRTQELPDMFHAVRMKTFELERRGNEPAYEAKLVPFYSASLPKDDTGRAAALALLKKMGLEGLVKNSFKVDFGKGENKRAVELQRALKKMKIPFSNSVGVHAQTLTAEIRRRYEGGEPLSPAELETLGGHVGEVVKLNKKED